MADHLAPTPRIGQVVVLRDGRRGEVATILRGVGALRPKREVEMLLLAASLRSELGPDWANIYYEATVLIHDSLSTIETVTPNKVVAVEEPD